MVRSYPQCFGDAEPETYVCSVECPYFNRCLKETFGCAILGHVNPELALLAKVLVIDDCKPLSVKRRHDALVFVEKCWVKKI